MITWKGGSSEPLEPPLVTGLKYTAFLTNCRYLSYADSPQSIGHTVNNEILSQHTLYRDTTIDGLM